MGRILKNHIKTKREFRTFYRKNIRVLLKVTLGNIKKKKLNLKELVKSKWLSKKLNYIKIGLFKIINKITEISYRLDLLLKIKIHLVYYIAILKPVYKNHKLPVYK